MGKKRLIFRYIKMFLLSILILINTVVLMLSLTAFNKSFILKQFNSEHYNDVEQSIKTKMKESMISSGIDNKVIDSMFSEIDIRKTTEEAVSIIYDYNTNKLNTRNIRNQLKENINKNLEELNYTVENMSDYNKFVDSIMDIYESEFDMLGYIDNIGKYSSIIIKINLILAVMLTAITLIIILVRHKKMPVYLPPALFTTSFILLFGCIYSYNVAGLSSITIFSPTFSAILRKIINEVYNSFYIISVVYILLGITVCFFVKRRHHHHM